MFDNPTDGRRHSYLGGIRQVLRARRKLFTRGVISVGLISISQFHSQLHELLLRQEVLGVVALHVFFEPKQRVAAFSQSNLSPAQIDKTTYWHHEFISQCTNEL